MDGSSDSKLQFLGSLCTLLCRADIAYNAYLKNGRKFLYARILKKCNESILDILIWNTHLLPAEQQANSIALLHHIDVWGTIWEETVKNEIPKLDAFFVFESEVRFPRAEVASLMDYYAYLKDQLLSA